MRDGNTVTIITATGAEGHGKGCCCHCCQATWGWRTWGTASGLGGHRQMSLSLLSGDAGTKVIGRHIILVVMAICHC